MSERDRQIYGSFMNRLVVGGYPVPAVVLCLSELEMSWRETRLFEFFLRNQHQPDKQKSF